MNFQSKFKGKANIIGKDGILQAINSTLPKQEGTQCIVLGENNAHMALSENGDVRYEEGRNKIQKILPKSNSAIIHVPKISPYSIQNNHSNLLMAGYNQVYQSNQIKKLQGNIGDFPLRSHRNADINSSDHSIICNSVKSHSPITGEYKYVRGEKCIMLGGLGPNIGTEEWNMKIGRKSEMMQFAKNINELNKEKLKIAPKRIVRNNEDETARLRALDYSKKIQSLLHSNNPVINHPLNVDKNIKEMEEIKQLYALKFVNIK